MVKLVTKKPKFNVEIIFYIGYFAFLLGATFAYMEIFASVMKFVKFAGLGILFIYFLYTNRESGWKTWLFLILSYIVVLIVMRISGTKLLLEILVLVTAFKDVDFNKFIKVDFCSRLGIVLLIVGLSLVGVIDNSISIREDGTMRYALGFSHPNMLALQTVFLTLDFVYLNRKHKNFWLLIVVLLVLAFNWKITDSRTSMMALLMLLPYLLFSKKMRARILGNKVVGYFLKASFGIFLLLGIFLVISYSSNNMLLKYIDEVFSGRLTLAHGYFKDYGLLEPFGNYMPKLNAKTLGLPNINLSVFDMGYLHILIRFGWIVAGALVVMYWKSMNFLQKNRNWTGMMILLVVSFYGLFETGAFFGIIDPFLVFLSAAFYGTVRGLTKKVAKSKGDVLLLTWVEGDNYGTLLQSWCLKQVITDFNSFASNSWAKSREVNVLNYQYMMDATTSNEKRGVLNRIKKFYSRSRTENINRFKTKIEAQKLKSKLQQRAQIFDKFREKELGLYPADTICRKEDLNEMAGFKTYMIGSDQVWNPKLLDSTYLLGWVPKGASKISYAPSICVGSISNRDLKKYATLKDFNALSVREYTHAAEQISHMIGKRIEEAVDPVILYGRGALLKHCRKVKSEEYCFSYLLGKSEGTRKYAINFARENNLKLKSVIGINRAHLLADKLLEPFAIWDLGLFDLVNTIYNSRVVITDSFHILIICILLHKEFIILAREDGINQQNNRLITMLGKINQLQRLGFAPAKMESLNFSEYGWEWTDYYIAQMRERSLAYLGRALQRDDRGRKVIRVMEVEERGSSNDNGRNAKNDIKEVTAGDAVGGTKDDGLRDKKGSKRLRVRKLREKRKKARIDIIVKK